MKMLKIFALSALFFIITSFLFSDLTFAAFSQSDLEGKWFVNALVSGSEYDYWLSGTITVNDQGSATTDLNYSLGASGSGGLYLDITSNGVITFVGDPSSHGIMNSEKNFFVMTDGNQGQYLLLVAFKSSDDAFSQSDLTGTWYGHTITTGIEEIWEYDTTTIDSSGNVSVTMTNSYGETETETDVAQVSMISTGILKIYGDENFHGTMSPARNVAVFNDTWDDNNTYALTVLAKSGGSYSQADLEGTWYGHTLTTGSGWQGWEYSIISVDSEGVATASYTDSDGNSESGSATLNITSNGVVSIEEVNSAHGIVTTDKNIAVLTETDGTNEYQLMILVRGSVSAPVANFSASPLSGKRPLEVSFNDESTGDITSWSWDFGDGSTGSDQNPSHTYTKPGTYTVSLTATGAGGSDIETITDFISVKSPGIEWLPILLDE